MSPGAIFPEEDSDEFLPIWSSVQPPALQSAARHLARRSARERRPILTNGFGNYWTASRAGRSWDVLNASGGAGVTCLGHDFVFDAARDIPFARGAFYVPGADFSNEWAEALEDFILKSMDYQMASLTTYNSGSDATEAALKLAMHYHLLHEGPEHERSIFIAREQSYHGATLSALGTSGHDARKVPYHPVLSHKVEFISACNPYRDLAEDETTEAYVARLATELDQTIREKGPGRVAGFLVEPVVGAALGCVAAVPGYLEAMKNVCRNHGVLFIVDEIMCGMGRTGYLHAWQKDGVVPDIQLVGKTFSGGFHEFSGMIVGHDIYDVFEQGPGISGFNHGHTFQNSPVGSAVTLAVQEYIRDHNLVKRVHMKGPELGNKLKDRLGNHRYIGDIRGIGYFWGILFVQDKASKKSFLPIAAVSKKIHDLGITEKHGIYIYAGAGSSGTDSGDHIMFMPAYNTTDEELDLMIERIVKLIEAFFDDYDKKLTSKL